MPGVRKPRTVRLTQFVYSSVLAHAGREPDSEVCGLVGGRDGQLETAYPVTNVAAEPARRFEMDPCGQLRAMRAMSARGEHWMAIYHSHVHAPAWPSDIDRDRHAYPDLVYLIAAPRETTEQRLRAFTIRNQTVRELSLRVVT